MQEPESKAALEEVKEASVSQLLIKAGRLANERGLSRIPDETDVPRLRLSHTAVLPHLSWEGTRMTALAERLSISKQAVSQLIAEMEDMGIVRRVPDPSDGRGKLVIFTENAPAMLMRGMMILRSVDADLEAALGKEQYQALRTSLLSVIQELSKSE
jgi:DNA-binding MarR family transcriptional regulator